MRRLAPLLPLFLLACCLAFCTETTISDPILAPELKYCHLPLNLPDGEIAFECCAPNWDRPAIDFQLNESDRFHVRVRKPAQDMDSYTAARLDKAYGLMRALPSEDPRSFVQQANIHCAYCSSSYQMGNSSTPLQVHASWLFFSFHRWYLYFHERILAHLLDMADEQEAAAAEAEKQESEEAKDEASKAISGTKKQEAKEAKDEASITISGTGKQEAKGEASVAISGTKKQESEEAKDKASIAISGTKKQESEEAKDEASIDISGSSSSSSSSRSRSRSSSNKEAFALPFWNYDHPSGMTIPEAYMKFPNLTDAYRDPSRLPPATVMVDYYYMNESMRTQGEQIAANLAAFHRMVVTGATTQYAFHGQPYRKDDQPEPGYGTVETMPHNSVHGWTGDHNQIGGKDMGTLYAAGRDPVFYAHHANMDRLWEVWKTLGNNQDISDEDYLNSEFVFYNEYAELVKVKVKDSLDPIKLGFTYADVENLWINTSSPSESGGLVATLSDTDAVCAMGEELVDPCSVVLSRDTAAHSVNAIGEGEEMILIDGIEGVLDAPAHFEAYLNLPQANVSSSVNCAEFVGRFSTMPQLLYNNMTGNYRKTSIRFPIGNNIETLGLSQEENVIVTLVPRTDSAYSTVRVKSISLYYETEGLSRSRRRGSAFV